MRTANGFGEFYSRMKGNDFIELFLDLKRNPTIDYPHVHIIHKGSKTVEVIASVEHGNHIWRTTLTDASGNEVNSAYNEARNAIIEYRKREYEERQRIREQKQSEYEERQRIRQQKQSEYEERQRIRQQKQSEYEERQRMREQKQREYEERQRIREQKQSEYEERMRGKIDKLENVINSISCSIDKDKDTISRLYDRISDSYRMPDRKGEHIRSSCHDKINSIEDRVRDKYLKINNIRASINEIYNKMS